jgi:hypothetical protein
MVRQSHGFDLNTFSFYLIINKLPLPSPVECISRCYIHYLFVVKWLLVLYTQDIY